MALTGADMITGGERIILEKTVKLELLEVSASEAEIVKDVRRGSKAGSRGLQENGMNAGKVKAGRRKATVGLLDATLSANVAQKHQGQPIEMGMFSTCSQGRV